jgi:glycosyltransferase involved in cell wall biosynthesis
MPFAKLSVIIPAFNAAKTLAASIESILAQRENGIEIVVVDDGSTDKTADVMQSYGDRIVPVFQMNRGASAARNAGLKCSSADLIKFLDADDYLLPGSLANQIHHAQSLDSNSISFGRTLAWFQSSGIIRPHGARDAREDNQDAIDNLIINTPVTASLIYPKGVIDRIGGFDGRVSLMDDFDLFVRAVMAGCKVVACAAPIYVYCQYDSGDRLSHRSSRADYKRLSEMFGRYKDTFASGFECNDMDAVRRGIAKMTWIKARTALRHGYESEARQMMATARALSAECVVGRWSYRALAAVVGPVFAEKILH